MTRWLLNNPIPLAVIVPTNQELGVETYEATVTGIGTFPSCPNCGRSGPIDALTLGDGTQWPNVVVICGRLPNDIGCGLYWALMPQPPHDLKLLNENL